MFYQKYFDSNNAGENSIKIVDVMEANTAYYLSNPPQDKPYIVRSGEKSYYEIPVGQQVLYNPLPNAIIENYEGNIYLIENILTNEVISKIQIEISEKNQVRDDALSFNSLFINNDKIHGYVVSRTDDENIYSFETIDDVSTKIRYLGIITPNGLSDGEFIILNYYTND